MVVSHVKMIRESSRRVQTLFGKVLGTRERRRLEKRRRIKMFIGRVPGGDMGTPSRLTRCNKKRKATGMVRNRACLKIICVDTDSE